MSSQGRKPKKIPRRKVGQALDLPNDELILLFDFNKLKKDALRFNSAQLYVAKAKELHKEMAKILLDVGKKYGVKSRLKTVLIMED